MQARGAGGRRCEVENPGRQPTKWFLANGIKKYQNISKNLKNCPAWHHTEQGLQVPVELPYTREACPGGQATASSRPLRRHSESMETPGIALPLQEWDQGSELAKSSGTRRTVRCAQVTVAEPWAWDEGLRMKADRCTRG